MSIVRLQATDGTPIEFDDKQVAGDGLMKDVYFGAERKYVVAWYKLPQDYNGIDRLNRIVGQYRHQIFSGPAADYWNALFCWPTHVVHHNDKVGVVVPAYDQTFYFRHGSTHGDRLSLRGREKEGRWFASAKHQQHNLDPRERGDWMSYLGICLKIARATAKMHAAGLAHSDLSYKNVLVDPTTARACIIDVDGLVVPGRFPPDVLGTPDFIAPEVMRTASLAKDDPARALPRRETDQHALAVLVYMYLLYRHPLRGRKRHHDDAARDEELGMGRLALFVEHPTDLSNRPGRGEMNTDYMPYADVNRIPYRVVGPYLRPLFERAFMEGLHTPGKRPAAFEWENALVKTTDLTIPCASPKCAQKWFVFDDSKNPRCPFCQTSYAQSLPVLTLYSSDGKGTFRPDGQRLAVHGKRHLYRWHTARISGAFETMSPTQKESVGYFAFHQGKWVFVNTGLTSLRDAATGESFRPGLAVELSENRQLILSDGASARLAHVQLAGPPK